MTIAEHWASTEYMQDGGDLEAIGRKYGISPAAVLHAVAVKLQRRRGKVTRCEECRWSTTGRACVLPRCVMGSHW